MIEGSLSLLGCVHNWSTSRWSATKKENQFSLNGNGIMSSFLGRQFYRSTLYFCVCVCVCVYIYIYIQYIYIYACLYVCVYIYIYMPQYKLSKKGGKNYGPYTYANNSRAQIDYVFINRK